MTKKYLIENLIPSDEVNIIYSQKQQAELSRWAKNRLEKYANEEGATLSPKELDLSYWEISIPKGTNQIQIKEIKHNEN
jgi:hypothetical protein